MSSPPLPDCVRVFDGKAASFGTDETGRSGYLPPRRLTVVLQSSPTEMPPQLRALDSIRGWHNISIVDFRTERLPRARRGRNHRNPLAIRFLCQSFDHNQEHPP